jgi:hypothetical protein
LKPDPLLNFPLGCCDKNGEPTLPAPGLCRGHLDRFDKEEPQVVWEAGQDAHFQLSTFAYSLDAPGSAHDGGSCQVGFSVDGGSTWKAAASFFGNCPHRGADGAPDAQTFDFKVPKGMPSGTALFVWVWLNREHEANVNCAKVSIVSKQGKTASTSQMNRASKVTANTPRSTIPSHTPERTNPQGRRNPVGERQTDVCDWASTPEMQTSYFTIDAECMPGAKLSDPKSDDFEYGWDVDCGVSIGDNAYPIHIVDCKRISV